MTRWHAHRPGYHRVGLLRLVLGGIAWALAGAALALAVIVWGPA